VLHGGWRCMEGVVDGLALHGKLLLPRWGLRMGPFKYVVKLAKWQHVVVNVQQCSLLHWRAVLA